MKSEYEDHSEKIAVISGGKGFIGRHLNLHLQAKGWKTILITRVTDKVADESHGNGDHLVHYDGSLHSLESLDLNDKADVVFFHLAAYTGLGSEIYSIDRIIDSNIRLGAHILEYMRSHGFRSFVYAESYWQFDKQGCLGGNTAYAASKSAFSMLAEYYSKSLNIISLVLYDVYGANDDRGKLVNFLIDSVLKRNSVDMTEGEQWLDFVYIEDVVRGFEVAGESLLESAIGRGRRLSRYTVRTLEHRKLRQFVDILGQAVGGAPIVRWGARPYPEHQIMEPWFPSGTAQLPGWSPSYSFYDGVRKMLT